MDREKLILETFELSRGIGYQHFLAENFGRPDPVLVKLNPEERKAFLRDWWDGARDRMYESYRQQVAACGASELLAMREAYIETLDAMGMLQWRQERGTDDRKRFEQILSGDPGKDSPAQAPVKTPDKGRDV